MSRERLKLETSNMAWLNLCNKTADIKQRKLHSVSQSYISHRSKTAKNTNFVKVWYKESHPQAF